MKTKQFGRACELSYSWPIVQWPLVHSATCLKAELTLGSRFGLRASGNVLVKDMLELRQIRFEADVGGTVAHLRGLASARNRLVAEATPKPPGPSGRRDLPARQPGRFVPVFFVQAALPPRHGGRQRGGGDGRA